MWRKAKAPRQAASEVAMKLCKCSYLGHPSRACTCSEEEVRRYRACLSGPLLDRIDLHLTLSPVPLRMLGCSNGAESSAAVRERVESARARQRARFASQSRLTCNAQASGRLFASQIETEGRQILDAAAESLSLSARAYHRVLKVARTIADLAAEDRIAASHVAEALRFR